MSAYKRYLMKLLILLVSSIISGILYRLGGWEKGNTKYRDAGCPLVFLLLIWILFGFHLKFWWAYLLTFGLSWAALTTYLDSIFGYDNFYAHGFMCGLAGIPLIWCGLPLLLILTRIVVCTVGMGLWSKLISWDVAEEFGRGVLFIL